jgi:hypothetical protein
MRNLLKSLGLLLLLITAQQGAVVHELSHHVAANSGGFTSADALARPGEFSTSVDVNSTDVRSASSVVAADANCALCPAFAQVLTPAFTHSFQVPLLARADVQRSRAPQYAAIEIAVPTPRSRGPPSLS